MRKIKQEEYLLRKAEKEAKQEEIRKAKEEKRLERVEKRRQDRIARGQDPDVDTPVPSENSDQIDENQLSGEIVNESSSPTDENKESLKKSKTPAKDKA